MVGFEPGNFEFLLTYLTCLKQLHYRPILYAQVLIFYIHGELGVINFSTLFSYRYNDITNMLRIW